MKIAISVLVLLALAFPARAADDSDQDGLTDDQEYLYGTDYQLKDTDADGYDDGLELGKGFSPLAADKTLRQLDSDKDGLIDDWEFKLGTATKNPDSDGDGYVDGLEVRMGFSPKSADKIPVEKAIKVSLKDQRLRYYFGGVELDDFLISSGVKSMPTPKGEFKILAKIPSKNYGGRGYDFYYPNTKWNLMFHRARLNYYIHGAYWHDKFGQPMSHGCVNVHYDNMGRLYEWAQLGTRVIIN